MSEYVKIKKQILKDIADAIRLQKNTNKTYSPLEFSELISKLYVLPSSEAEVILKFQFLGEVNSYGSLPDFQASSAFVLENMSRPSFITEAMGIVVEN